MTAGSVEQMTRELYKPGVMWIQKKKVMFGKGFLEKVIWINVTFNNGRMEV